MSESSHGDQQKKADFLGLVMSYFSSLMHKRAAQAQVAQVQAEASSARESIALENGRMLSSLSIEGSNSGFSSAGNVSLLSSVSQANANRDMAVISLQSRIASANIMAGGHARAFSAMMGGLSNSASSTLDAFDAIGKDFKKQRVESKGALDKPSGYSASTSRPGVMHGRTAHSNAQPHARGGALRSPPVSSNSAMKNNGWKR